MPENVDASLLQEPQERDLAAKLEEIRSQVTPLFAKRDYTESLKVLAGLRATVDAFFDHVMVMSEDNNLRDNRLALLNGLRNLFLQVADVSRLQA